MRLVITSDTHKPVDVNFIPNGDVFIHAGDLMRTGYPEDFEECIAWLDELPHAIKLYIPGNHDFHLQNYPGPALQELRKIGVTVIGLPGNTNFYSYRLFNNMKLLGLPYVTNLNRWAFNSSEEYLDEYLKWVGRYDVVISHAPPYGILDQLDSLEREHVGIKAYRKYAEEHKPLVWAFGHIHEGYGHLPMHGTHFYNVAMCDRNYNHVNPPVVIDL